MTTHEVYKQIGSVIRNRRKKLLMTQEALSARLGISRGSLANIETGRQNILVHQLYNFAAALDLDPSAFLPTALDSDVKLSASDLSLPSHLKRTEKEWITRLIDGADLPATAAGQQGEAGRVK